jgi:pyruvate dehydrogenase E1 component beta subunit
MSSQTRILSYGLAINEGLHQMMARDRSVFVIGQGVKSPWYVGNTCRDLLETFGPARVMDTPVSENAVTGAAVGAAIAGMRPVVVHPRMDFMMYAIDPIVNEAANWHYMCGGRLPVPVVIWGIVNRGGEQAAQHSQSLHAWFAHVPGLKVVMPSTPHDAKGLMVAAIRDPNPVVFIDDRWLHDIEGPVPERLYSVPIGRAAIRCLGSDVTLASTSYMSVETVKAADALHREDIKADVIDLRTIKPLDERPLMRSVQKTGRLLVVDGGWRTCGFAAEVAALVSESAFSALKAPVRRLTLPDVPAPASRSLEEAYYPDWRDITRAAKRLVRGNHPIRNHRWTQIRGTKN